MRRWLGSVACGEKGGKLLAGFFWRERREGLELDKGVFGEGGFTYGPAAGNAFAVVIFFISLDMAGVVMENWRVIEGRVTVLVVRKRLCNGLRDDRLKRIIES